MLKLLNIELYCILNFLLQSFPSDDMGISLSRAATWTTASCGAAKLEFTQMNEDLLKEMLCLVEQFSSEHPEEAKHVFDEPLQWKTTLVSYDFNSDYDIRLV